MSMTALINFLIAYVCQFNDWNISNSWNYYTFSINIYDYEETLVDNLLKCLTNNVFIDNTIIIETNRDTRGSDFMVVIKTGSEEKRKSGILFVCENCKSEFIAKRKEVKITPPCMEFEYYKGRT